MDEKKKKILIRVLAIVLAVAVAGGIVALLVKLVKNVGDQLDTPDLIYDEFSTDYTADKDSWLQIDPDDEDVNIRWWVDSTNWDFYQIADLVYKRTGVRIKFEKALTTDGQELATMISGTLPDVITITDFSRSEEHTSELQSQR